MLNYLNNFQFSIYKLISQNSAEFFFEKNENNTY